MFLSKTKPLSLQRHSHSPPPLDPGIFPSDPEVAPAFGSWNSCTAAPSAGRTEARGWGLLLWRRGIVTHPACRQQLPWWCTKSAERLCARKAGPRWLPTGGNRAAAPALPARASAGLNPRIVETSGAGSPTPLRSY